MLCIAPPFLSNALSRPREPKGETLMARWPSVGQGFRQTQTPFSLDSRQMSPPKAVSASEHPASQIKESPLQTIFPA